MPRADLLKVIDEELIEGSIDDHLDKFQRHPGTATQGQAATPAQEAMQEQPATLRQATITYLKFFTRYRSFRLLVRLTRPIRSRLRDRPGKASNQA